MRIKPGGILQDERLQPTLRCGAIKRMIYFFGFGIAVSFKIPNQPRKFRRRRGRKAFPKIYKPKGNALSAPDRELQSSETNCYFSRSGCDASFDCGRSAGRQCSNARNAFQVSSV